MRSGRSRRNFIVAVGTGIIAAPFVRLRPANAAEFVYKFSHALPAAHPMNLRTLEGAKRIAEESSGRMEIQVYPNSQLGSDPDAMKQTRAGSIEFVAISGPIVATLVPLAAINGLAFAFKSYDQVWKAMDGELGSLVRDEIGKRGGLLALDWMWDNGYRQVTSSTRPIQRPEDLKGFKIRVPLSPLWTSLFSSLGASPTSINFNEAYSALQTGIVDGMELPLSLLDSSRMYEVQKFCSLTSHMWDGFYMLANPAAWNALPSEVQAIVSANWKKIIFEERQDVASLNASLQSVLEGKGLKFNAVDTDAFRDVLKKADFYKNWKTKFGDKAWSLLEATTGPLS